MRSERLRLWQEPPGPGHLTAVAAQTLGRSPTRAGPAPAPARAPRSAPRPAPRGPALTLMTGFLLAGSGTPCGSPSSYSRRKCTSSTGPSWASGWKWICAGGFRIKRARRWDSGGARGRSEEVLQAGGFKRSPGGAVGTAQTEMQRCRVGSAAARRRGRQRLQHPPRRPSRTRPSPPLSAQTAGVRPCATGC